jgi:hypothetical protein
MVKTNDLGFDLRRGTSQTIKNPAADFNQNLDEVTCRLLYADKYRPTNVHMVLKPHANQNIQAAKR